MKVTLLTDIKGLGMCGDTCEVKDGYAMNLLIPQKKAAECTDTQALQLVQKRQAQKKQREQSGEQASATIASLPDTITIHAPANEQGTLFNSVTGDVLAAQLQKEGFPVAVEWLSLTPLKTCGAHSVTIAHGDTEKTVTLTIQNESDQ